MTTTTSAQAPTVESVIDNFVVIIGAQRCGSTLLHRMLDAHPEISMVKPARPEPKVFLDAGLTAAGLDAWIADRRSGFDPSAELFGEKSTSYIESPVAAENIRLLVPRARLIAIVRNPIERAVSNYRFSVANGLESDPLEVALQRELSGVVPDDVAHVSVSPFAYLQRGLYAEHLTTYEDRFGPDRLRVVMLEELVGRPDSLAGLYRWLGVSDSFRPQAFEAVNATDGDPPPLSSSLRSRLADYYRAPNTELADRHGLDTTRWN